MPRLFLVSSILDNISISVIDFYILLEYKNSNLKELMQLYNSPALLGAISSAPKMVVSPAPWIGIYVSNLKPTASLLKNYNSQKKALM
nr:MAG TPA: hypothetical protein [Caudoviricetes sp.]